MVLKILFISHFSLTTGHLFNLTHDSERLQTPSVMLLQLKGRRGSAPQLSHTSKLWLWLQGKLKDKFIDEKEGLHKNFLE